jgi:anti-sigma regulatory factor (Ser/Thr protein kinase)
MSPAREPAMSGCTNPDGSDAFERAYEGTLQSLRSTRTDVSAWLRAIEADQEMVERAVLVASELASNAVQAAAGCPYRVTIQRAGESLIELAVSNQFVSTGPPDRDRWSPSIPTAPRGRGLSIVEALSRDVRVEVDDSVVRVTALLQTARDG